MHALKHWETRFPRIAQRSLFWCIPACVENILGYHATAAITQEELILSYCNRFGNDALFEVRQVYPLQFFPVEVQGLDRSKVIDIARRSAFKHGNCETFAEAARTHAAFPANRLKSFFQGGLNSKGDYFNAVTDALEANCPVLISIDNGNSTFHIQAVVEVDTTGFGAFDPAANTVKQFDLNHCKFSNDILFLKDSS
jgi:hypothetical protein